MKIKNIIIVFMAISLLLTGCTGTAKAQADTQAEDTDVVTDEVDEASRELFAMDTYMTLTAYGDNAEQAVEEAASEIERLDALLSTGDENSEILAINENGGGELSADTAVLIERSIEIYEKTQGAFNIAVYPIMEAWGFTTQEYKVPSEQTLQELLKLTDASKMNYDDDAQTVSFEQEGMKIDLGGIAKGYTSNRVMDIFREWDVDSGMVNLGGNVQVLGEKTDGTQWRVAIQSPDDSGDYLGVLSTQDKAVITSGGYERYFEEDGVIYHHIIDPATGYPAENGLTSVTIVSADGTMADGLSTSLFVMGKEQAVAFWRKNSDEFDTILLADDGSLYVTEGIADSFTSDIDFQIIEK